MVLLDKPAYTGRARVARPRGESKQDYCTPRVFLDAVERKFGPIVWDLAATAYQSVIGYRLPANYFGPDHVLESRRDALSAVWNQIEPGLRWLNPPFSHIAPWVKRCALYASATKPIALLVPASIGANWYWDYVAPNARTFSVGRMMFVIRHEDGSETPACFDKHGKPTNYNKNLMFCVFGMSPGGERWKWKA